MEHEDNNTQFNNFFPNAQSLMENLQIASGGLSGDLVVGHAGSNSNIEGKFEEHKEQNDEEEWKYIHEVQQTEKQQQPQTLIAGDEVENGNGNIDSNAALLDKREIDVGNGNGYGHGVEEIGNDDGVAAAVSAATAVAFEQEDEEEVKIIKNDGAFSTKISYEEEYVGEEREEVSTGILQVEMKIEENFAPREETEEEEPSSLATNTTNGTSSLSENLILQQNQQVDIAVENDKENADPRVAIHSDEIDDFEMHSQLNPDAKEFIPSFSNPTTPTSPPFSGINNAFACELVTVSAVPRYLGEDEDDFVAQSPRKGQCADMDAFALPPVNEFQHGAANRPHELEKEYDLIGVDAEQHISEMLSKTENIPSHGWVDSKSPKAEHESPALFMDHGPETCVDLDANQEQITEINNDNTLDVMRQLVYGEQNEDEPIEVLLNTVQTLPNDDSDDDVEPAIAGDKELLNVEEKEHISHSPSTEEMAMNIQNDLHSSAKDISQIPNDMQQSFYMEHTSADAQSLATDQNYYGYDQNARENLNNFLAAATESKEVEFNNTFAQYSTNDDNLNGGESLSPQSTEEKHLVEETKETANLVNDQIMCDEQVLSVDPVPQAVLEETVSTSHTTLEESPFIDQFAALRLDSNSEQTLEEVQTRNEHDLQPNLLQNDQFIPNDQIFTNQQLEAQFEQQQQAEQEQIIELTMHKQLEAESLLAASQPVAQPESDTILISDDDSPVKAAAVAVAPVEPAAMDIAPVETEPIKIVPENVLLALDAEPINVESTETEIKPLVVAATTLAAAVVATTTAVIAKKSETTKKSATTKGEPAAAATKHRVSDKKPSDVKKIGATTAKAATTNAAARPRTAPAKTSGVTSTTKKTLTSVAPAAASTTATRAAVPKAPAAARPLTANGNKIIFRNVTAAKTSNGTAAAPTTRKITSAPVAATATTAKPRTTVTSAPPSAAAAKSTALGLPAPTNKPKLSPRSTLTSQLRKAGPTAAATAKSPNKPTPTALLPTSNVGQAAIKQLGAANVRTTTINSRPATAPATKTFTARPAPKMTVTAATAAKRTATTNTTNTLAPKTITCRKITTSKSPSKSPIAPRVGSKLSPNKSPLKSNTKEAGSGDAAKDIKQKPIGRLPPAAALKLLNGGAECGSGDALTKKEILNGGDSDALNQQKNGEGSLLSHATAELI